jgi:Fe-S cluster biogenesis protein NfuA
VCSNKKKGHKKVEEKIEEKIKKIIEEKIRPALVLDGGGIDFMGMDGNNVKVRLQGACQGCPSAQITLQMGVLRLLKQEIPEIEDVIPV